MLTHLDVIKTVRELAKGSYYQAVYKQAKEINIKLFENDTEFTDIQIHFMTFLSFYSNLYTDCAMGEVSELVLEDDIYADAYFAYKIKSLKGTMDKISVPPLPQKRNPLEYTEKIGESSWVFRKNRGQQRN